MPESPEALAEGRETIHRTLIDPVSKLLLGNSHLTLTQLETLLAASISSEKNAKRGQRRLFRPSRARISRGSYNRTLIQAQNNVIRSIYTILLLGYVGLFDTPTLQPFLELSDELQGYMEELKTASNEAAGIDQLKARLWEVTTALAKRQSFKDAL
jgi:hypothetical protein